MNQISLQKSYASPKQYLFYRVVALVFAICLSSYVLAIESVVPRDVGISASRAEIFRNEL